MPTYSITAPNGKTLEIAGEAMPNEAQLHDIFAKAGVDTGAPAPTPAASGHDYKILGINIHVPAPDKPRLDSNVVGWGEQGAGVSPEDLLMGGQAVRAVAKATSTGGVLAGVKSSVAQASPLVKYELTRRTLTAMGVPDHFATLAGLAIAGLKKGEVPDAAPEGPHLDRSVPVSAGSLSQQQLAERIKFGTGDAPQTRNLPKGPVGVTSNGVTSAPPVASAPVLPAPAAGPVAPASAPPPIAESAASPIRMGPDGRLVGRPGGNPDLPDQRALNEAAIAERRATTQAKVTKPANVKLNAAETSAYLNLMLKGQSSSDAMASVLQQRELVAALGTPTPTAAQTRFPKGMRGKASPSQ